MAVTSTAQSVISTTYTTFEAFIGDNALFIDLDECFFWINENLKDQETFEMDSWIEYHDVDDVFDRLKSHFYKWKREYEKPLYQFLSSFTEEELTRIYYKNNLHGFIEDHLQMIHLCQTIFEKIPHYEIMDEKDKTLEENNYWKTLIPKNLDKNSFKSIKDWNKYVFKETFCDPNTLPSKVETEVKELSAYLMKYVYARYLTFDRIHRLKNFYRNTVTVIDTDSNILSLDRWVEFTKEKIMESDYQRDELNNVFISVNMITYVITEVVQDILLYYGEMSNIPEEFRSRFNMKNEFFFTKLVIASVKKRYLSSIKLREGNLLNPEKVDIKGFDFRKSTTSENASKLFKSYVKKYILEPEYIDTKELETVLFNFQDEVHESIRNGETTYLPVASVKEIAAYADPASEQSIRGYLAWNLLNPEQQIEVPSKVGLVKLTLFRESDIEPIKETYPDVYWLLKEKIFHDKTGFFVSKRKNGDINVRGLQALAIPFSAKIPEWCIPYIDYSNMINSILSPFKSVMDLLKIQYAPEGRTINGISRKSDGLTNIIKF